MSTYLRLIYYSLDYCVRLRQQGMGESPISDKDGLNDFNVPIDTSIHPPGKHRYVLITYDKLSQFTPRQSLEGDVPLCIFKVRCGAERKRGELLRPNPLSDTADGLSRPLHQSVWG